MYSSAEVKHISREITWPSLIVTAPAPETHRLPLQRNKNIDSRCGMMFADVSRGLLQGVRLKSLVMQESRALKEGQRV